MTKEIKILKLRHLKAKLQKKFPGAYTACSSEGLYYVADKEGRNIIGEKYRDLAFTDEPFDAWTNLATVEYWNRIEERNNRGFAYDIEHSTVQNESDYFDTSYLITNQEDEL